MPRLKKSLYEQCTIHPSPKEEGLPCKFR